MNDFDFDDFFNDFNDAKVRSVLLMVLNKEGPRSLYGFQYYEDYGKKVAELGKENMMMAMQPLEETAIRTKILQPLKDFTEEMKTKASSEGQHGDGKTLEIFAALLQAVEKGAVISDMVDIGRTIQGK